MSRSCGTCTACCDGWLKATIDNELMYPGKPCQHCKAGGCAIYENRPQSPCRDFQCAWLEHGTIIPENLKPSECGAILLVDRPWHGINTIRAIPAGASVPPQTLESIKDLARELKAPLIFFERIAENDEFIGQKQIGFGPPSFIHAVQTELEPEDVMQLEVPTK